LRDGDRLGARSLDHGRQLEGEDEQRPAHADHPQQDAVVVQSTFELGRLQAVEASAGGEEDAGGIGRVKPDHPTCDLHRAARRAARCQEVPPGEPCAPLVD
jgi:hypothetical protein